jgi:hypothetical protein
MGQSRKSWFSQVFERSRRNERAHKKSSRKGCRRKEIEDFGPSAKIKWKH